MLVALRGVASQTKRPIGCQSRNGGGFVTVIAGHVGIARRRVHIPQVVTHVTCCTRPTGGVVVLMAVHALRHALRRREAYRGRMAVHTAERVVPAMPEHHVAGARGAIGDRDRQRDSDRLIHLRAWMACTTFYRGGVPMMTDLTTAGRIKREIPVAGSGPVAREAREIVVAVVREGVLCCGEQTS